MADSPRYRTPRWVMVVGIIVIVLALLVGLLLLTGVGGDHGPGRHLPSGGAGGRTPPSGIIVGHTPPGGNPGGHTPAGEPGVQRP